MFLSNLASLMFRNGKIGITTLLKIFPSWIISRFKGVSNNVEVSGIYPEMYMYPDKLICRLFKNRCFSGDDLKKFFISYLKHMVRKNRIMPAENPHSPYFREFADYFNKLVETNGILDNSEQKAFAEICKDRLYMKYFSCQQECPKMACRNAKVYRLQDFARQRSRCLS